MPRGVPRDDRLKKEKAIELAIEGKTWTQIAKEVGVTTNTIWHWRKDPVFQTTLTKLQEEVYAETALKHNIYLSNGMAVLNEIAIDKSVGVEQRISAAEKLITMTHRNVEAIKVIEQNRKILKMYEQTDPD